MIGKTISHYKILEKLGEGGMGVVYKAEDTKLKREVALKFLPTNALQGQEDKDRFTREAQAAAALNHPNIAHIYAIDEADGQMFLAMEFIEGQELVGAIRESPLRIDQAIDYATQIAAGLQAAHEKGITHRDIKSANIMVTEKGQVKIMDFGLAKLANRSKMTQLGTTLGTAAYMSPEQARGEEADNCADIWSLGVVLYEMISGQLPFKGDYEQAVIYSILNEEPEPLTALRSGLPIALDGIIAKALAKEPDTRYQHVDELPADLKGIDSPSLSKSRITTRPVAGSVVPAGAIPKQLLTWATAFIAGVLLTGFASWFWPRPSQLAVKRWTITLPETAPIAPIGSATYGTGQPALTISPDGTNLVYVADTGGDTQLYLRPLNQFDSAPIPGSEGAFCPFFSADGEWIGFFAGIELKKVSIAGGAPVSLCEVVIPFGASWGPDNRIVVTENSGARLFWISASGGPKNVITDGDRILFPEILPNGKAVLLAHDRPDSGKVIFIESNKKKILGINGRNLKYMPSGHLVYSKEDRLEAVAFDLDDLRVLGTPVPILDDIRIESSHWAAQGTVSKDGTLVYLPGGSVSQTTLVWLDRNGNTEQLPFPVENHGGFQLSPDGRKLAIALIKNGKSDIWIYDLIRNSSSKLTHIGDNNGPVWSRSGKHIAFASNRSGAAEDIFIKSVDGEAEAKRLMTDGYDQKPYSFAPDDKRLVFTDFSPGGWNNYTLDVSGESKPQPITSSGFNEWGGTLSRDGQWFAYTSDEQGQDNVYVKRYPPTEERWPISSEGGESAIWSRSTHELIYRNRTKWMVVSYETTPTFSPDVPKLLFEGDYANISGIEWDISPDGDRFLLLKRSEESSPYTRLNVVTNWFEELKRKVPSSK